MESMKRIKTKKKAARMFIVCSFVFLISAGNVGRCERIKDIVDIQGIRGNPLTGIGLVIGLAGTGDGTLPSAQMLTSILRDSGMVLTPGDLSGGKRS